jgi:phosphatidylserine decarboxylase
MITFGWSNERKMKYRFHREGIPTLVVTLIAAFIVFLMFSFFYSRYPWVTYTAVAIDVAALLMVLQFFRNPERKCNASPDMIYAPADGKIVVIEKVTEDEYLNKECIKISIFMSPFNVHVNRYPVSGLIKYVRYHPGKFLAAWEPKSSLDNERTTVVIQHEKGEVLLRQIAGALARRIVCYSKEGMQAVQGQEMGFIKFGSRVDVYVPVTCNILVKPGDIVKSPINSIASFQ